MVQTGLICLSIVIQILTLYAILRLRFSFPPQGGEAEKKPLRFMTPHGLFAVESTKRSPKVNDDETLFEREREKR
jgi:hypothetical protein